MANRVKAPERSSLARYSTAAQAMDRPSRVPVPRPISSRTTRERGVAARRMWLNSVISTMKVDCPDARSSWAPMRVKTLSRRGMSALSAGTKEPMCAIRAIRAVWRI
ncbi:MAG: hypothetical protein BWY28_00274 [bacterium ADurb.Bin236]|nr:MAG: hypothetical protein BWY28_00274 [bacterium ADurb.Bin236]